MLLSLWWYSVDLADVRWLFAVGDDENVYNVDVGVGGWVFRRKRRETRQIIGARESFEDPAYH